MILFTKLTFFIIFFFFQNKFQKKQNSEQSMSGHYSVFIKQINPYLFA